MSVEVKLNITDYHNLMNWYELAFAKEDNSTEQDDDTWDKLLTMAESFLENEGRRIKS